MNEAAVRLEEKIISLFSGVKTEIYHGWVLKEMPCYMVVYPLYGSADCDVARCIRRCEEICCEKSLRLVFRIVEHTNYYLTARLEDNGYEMMCCRMIMERCMDEESGFCNQKQQGILYLPDGELFCDTETEDVFQFAIGERDVGIVVDIPENEELLKYYEKAGFCKAYLYRCYQKVFD